MGSLNHCGHAGDICLWEQTLSPVKCVQPHIPQETVTTEK